MPFTHPNPPRLTHADTIRYEIFMLRFAANRLREEQWKASEDAWVYLESFLVHFRNLIEFLGKPKEELRADDLHITNIWDKQKVSPPDTLHAIRSLGTVLFYNYERGDDRISKYLQHCTDKRIESKDWRIDEMYNQIEPLLGPLETALSPVATPHFRSVPAARFQGPHPANAYTLPPLRSYLPILRK